MTEKNTLENLYRLQAIAAAISNSARLASGSAMCAAQFMAGRNYPTGSGEGDLTVREKNNIGIFRASLNDMQRYIDHASADLDALGFAPIKASLLDHPSDIDDEEQG